MLPFTTPTSSSTPDTTSRDGAGSRPPATYSPSKRTALVFTGSGVHGAYHAGALRALHESGVRVDIVAGHGVGAATAVLAAIDGGAKLWDDGGVWAPQLVGRYYRWRWPVRVAGWLSVLLAVGFAIPLAVLALAAVGYLAGFALTLVGLDAGAALTSAVSARLSTAFEGPNLPTAVPRLVMVLVGVLGLVMGAGVLAGRPLRPAEGQRRMRGPWWWRLASAPLDTAPLRQMVTRAVWDLVRGAAPTARPSAALVSRRYVEVLTENLGQPSCRELLIGASDLDARHDIVGALLREPYRQRFLASQPGRERGAETLDFSAGGREMVFDLVGAALTPPAGADGFPMTFPGDGFWRGETHRGCDRPGMLLRLLADLDRAGVAQVILVSAVAPALHAHRLEAPRYEPRARLGEFVVAAESAACADATRVASQLFDAVYMIAPVHNPVGPFDGGGTYDRASDRSPSVRDLQQQGYTEAYHQFIEPVVGASGEALV